MRKTNQKKIITLCSSASFYKECLEIEEKLKKMGFKVKVPSTAYRMKKSGDYNVDTYKTWYKDPSHYKAKTKLMKDHFKKALESDAVLIVNKEKNGIEGYIGGNGLMEMALAFHYKKPIFIWDKISPDLNIKEEILGMNPIFINKDLSLIKKGKF